MRFGGDMRRVYSDMIGNTGNSTGNVHVYRFVHGGRRAPAQPARSSGFNGFASSGSSLADMLLGLPQETTLQSAYQEAHLRENESTAMRRTTGAR